MLDTILIFIVFIIEIAIVVAIFAFFGNWMIKALLP